MGYEWELARLRYISKDLNLSDTTSHVESQKHVEVTKLNLHFELEQQILTWKISLNN